MIYTEQGSAIEEYTPQYSKYFYFIYTILEEKLYAIDGSQIYCESALSPFVEQENEIKAFIEQGNGNKVWLEQQISSINGGYK